MRKRLGISLFATTITIVATTQLIDVAPAEACGGCFVPPSESTVVTDHRMALSMSRQQTVLWDQIRYSGDPREFAWVLPVRQGAKIELANDEFFTALDTSSQPTIFGPTNFGGNLGCGLAGCGEDGLASAASDGANGGGNVTVISQSVVGPYEQVTLRATDEDALTKWLRANDFTIPPAIEPTIAAYVSEGFDFIALKLRPQCSERSMRPVRVVSPGADPTLPLRMVAAGVGAEVGIILYVITEGRYEPENFPSTKINDDDLRWSRFENKSNYEPLSQEIMKRENGRTWILEYADKPQIATLPGYQRPTQGSFNRFGRSAQTPGLTDVYYGLCKGHETFTVANSSSSSSGFSSSSSSSGFSSSSSGSSSGGGTFTPCPEQDAGNQNQFPQDSGGADSGLFVPIDGGGDGDGGDDEGDDDAGLSDAGAPSSDAGDGGIGDGENKGDGGISTPKDPPASLTGNPAIDCAYLDDLDKSLEGLNRSDVWVTRMRSILPTQALTAGDLRLKPSVQADGRADTSPISNLHWTPYYSDEDRPTSNNKTGCEGSPKRHRTYGSWILAMVGALVGITTIRRQRRRR